MTAEIVICNKTAIALAADSAVTLTVQDDQKIYNTVNKLFTLSKYHPVGIMVFGNAEFMGIPWESIIKEYRKALGTDKFNSLNEYCEDFINFIDNNSSLFPKSEQDNYFKNLIYSFFNHIKEQIDTQIKSIIAKKGSVDDGEISDVVKTGIKKQLDDWEKFETLPNFPKIFSNEISKKYKKVIEQGKNDVFKQLPISEESFQQLLKVSCLIFTKKGFFPSASGVVIAGYGNDEIFPSVYEFTIECLILNKLKHEKKDPRKINFRENAFVIPFAQSEMVATFMEGIDPFFQNTIEGFLKELFVNYPDYLIKAINLSDKNQASDLNKKLKIISDNLLSEFKRNILNYKLVKHIKPITSVVAVLPKDELAAMAESLVNLTSFKRKISLDRETVGGPIDVAVISKGDGFVWIKRKHYFKPELNPYFFKNYFR